MSARRGDASQILWKRPAHPHLLGGTDVRPSSVSRCASARGNRLRTLPGSGMPIPWYGTGMVYHFELLKLGGLAVLKQCCAGALILAIQSASSKHAGSASSTAAKPQTTQQ